MKQWLNSFAGFLPLGVLWLCPLVAGLLAVLVGARDGAAWVALIEHPQLWPSLTLSVATGTLSLVISALVAFWIVAGLYGSKLWSGGSGLMGGFLSLPHLAFAIGFGFLITPSGLIARVIGTLAGWAEPPQWVTTQDPFGLSLIAVLVLKEVPFLIWLIGALLARPDISQMLRGHFRVSQSLGHGSASVWLRVFIPQILPRLKWPMLIVWFYSASVVDVALAIGPTQPPPLSVIIWSDLNNADPNINARGTVGALFLTGTLGCFALFFWALQKVTLSTIWNFLTRGPSPRRTPKISSSALLFFFFTVYAMVFVILCVMSFGTLWPYPNLFPAQWRWSAWGLFVTSPMPLLNSLSLACASTLAASALAIFWFESIPEKLDTALLACAIAALALPSLLIADGQYLAFLHLGLNGTWFGVFLAHLTPVFAYVFIVLKGPYRAFDPRYRSVSLGLNTDQYRFWSSVKLAMMKPALAAAAAVGIGVSIAQYVPAQLIAAGRMTTLPIEAVTLSSGGNRPLLAVFALMLAVVPALAFIAAARLGRKTL
jgi:putative thiamine transport system permease protein